MCAIAMHAVSHSVTVIRATRILFCVENMAELWCLFCHTGLFRPAPNKKSRF